jgi:hypothetical protein
MTRLANPIPSFTFIILALAFSTVEAKDESKVRCFTGGSWKHRKCAILQGTMIGLLVLILFGTPRLFTHFHLVDLLHQQ